MRLRVLAMALTTAVVLSACGASSTSPNNPTTALGAFKTPPIFTKSWGFGSVKPRFISTGGDAHTNVGGIKWQSWGGPMAVGHGFGTWSPPTGDMSPDNEFSVRATVVLFEKMRCWGHDGYGALEWYFPSKGENFVNPIWPGRCGTIDLVSGEPGSSYVSVYFMDRDGNPLYYLDHPPK